MEGSVRVALIIMNATQCAVSIVYVKLSSTGGESILKKIKFTFVEEKLMGPIF